MGLDLNVDLNFDIIFDFLEGAKDAEGVVLYDAPHAIYVEFPTEYDKAPPFDQIYPWVERNISISGEETYEEVTYRIINYLKENGTDGVYYLSATRGEYEAHLDSYLDELDTDLNTNDPATLADDIVQTLLMDILHDSKEKIEQSGAIDTGELYESGHIVMDVTPEDIEAIPIEEGES